MGIGNDCCLSRRSIFARVSIYAGNGAHRSQGNRRRKSETRLGHETFASRIQNPKYFSNSAFPFRQNCEKTRRNQLAEGIIRLWKIEDISPLKSTVVQSLLHSFLACVSHQLFRAVDSKNRDLPKPGCQGTGIKPRTTAKLQHFGTGRWLSRRPKRTNDSPGIIAENFFAAKTVNPGSSLKQVISSLARVNRLWFRNRDCCS